MGIDIEELSRVRVTLLDHVAYSMFECTLPFLVRRVRDCFWLDGYEMFARAPIRSRRLDRLNCSQLFSALMRNGSAIACLPARSRVFQAS
jgi:hypothetical protein